MERRISVLPLLGILGLSYFFLAFSEQIHYDSGNRRDPFTPLLGPGAARNSKSKSDLHIEGIIYDAKSSSLVLINGEFYKAGDKVNNATVVSIFKDRVVLQMEDAEKT